MSRIGKRPIEIPSGVTIELRDGVVYVNGPLGSESQAIHTDIGLKIENDTVVVVKNGSESDRKLSAFHGLYRSLIANMVTGVSKGFVKELDIIGVGYRATQQDRNVVFQLGYSHNIVFSPPEGITVEVAENTKIFVKGINKQIVGQVASDIRKLRPPESYKGKGIRYKNEFVRKKAGKAGKAE
jgi:large subunit ribosomal protein L6